MIRRPVVNRTWTNRYWNNSYNLTGATRYVPVNRTYTYWPSNYYQYIRPPANNYSYSYQWPSQYQLYGVPATTQQYSMTVPPVSPGDSGVVPTDSTQTPNPKQTPPPGPKGKSPKGATKTKS